jgi:carbon storage regulator
MLVLTRHLGEEIIIEGDIHVTVVAIDRGKVRLGISAPPEIRVDRKEVHKRREEFEASGPREPPNHKVILNGAKVRRRPRVPLGNV